MKARVNRFYWEEVEEIINVITERISQIESSEHISPYCEDKKRGLLQLLTDLEEIGRGTEHEKIH